jgi:hypothetical protein
MKCFYYLAPTIKSTHDISDDLHAVGIKDFYIHIISKDESGLKQHHLHSSNYLETMDVIRIGFLGAFGGFVVGLIGVELLRFFKPFGDDFVVPEWVYLIVVSLATLFGAWEGGLIGIGVENNKLKRFHDDVEAGKYLILIYALKKREEAVRAMMAERHAEAELAAVDRYFLNPFARIVRSVRGGDGKAMQKG